MGDLGWSRRAAAAALACVATLALSGCDLRLETDPVTFPSPGDATVARNTLADAEAAVLAAATEAGASADSISGAAATAAQAHLDALGGVYIPYPGSTPSPSASPVAAPTLAQAIAAARAAAEEVEASTDDADLATLARSIDLDWALRELWAVRSAAAPSATTDGTDPTDAADSATEAAVPDDAAATPALLPRADGTTDASAGFVPGEATGIDEQQLSELALAEDQARFAYETIAALEFGVLQEQVLARSRLHAERSDALAALLTTDPRDPIYQLRDANLAEPTSREALERAIETDLGARYAALLDGASEADAGWLMNAAFDSYARAMATAGFAAADLPTLPGLTVVLAETAVAAASATPSPTAG